MKRLSTVLALTMTLALSVVPLPAVAGRSTLQRDADAVHAVGVTGVIARETTPYRTRTVVSGVGELRGRSPRPDGRFRIGSTNKALVATVVLQLVAEQRMRLDDSVETWLPGLVQGNGYDGRRITVRQLLQHTAGIYDGNFPNIENAQQYYERRYTIHTEEEIVRAGLSHPPEFQPGKGWSYSNTGYDLAGLVIKAVTGRTWYDEVDRRIVRPLGLRHTYFPGTDPRIAGPHAHGYTRFTAGEYTDTTELIDADASGGYISTVKELDTIVRAMFDGRLLRPAQLREMMRTVPTDGSADEFWPNARYGLGLFSRDLPCGGTVWIPSGDQIGYKTRTGVTPGGRRSVVVSMSTQLNDSMPAAIGQEKAAKQVVDNALCQN
ncbi:serine hydrolase domain-containing protein [Kribbella sindirgiensis]|uniref:Class A beta-lactamase-related serine hydrolase n=1 Tax=Kribbella sindirgiensis TaxID=1124744 RepID=A0A4R0IUB2_9ACTN|nr:serine hydrolase domain-containing protein [Kribbella sindirgiensis]TCC32315.1 class A beta-lactamase-related serine hydrolase [Kribbella sindirgiensis]